MGIESYSFKLMSHPDKLLIDHLRMAGRLCRESAKNIPMNVADKDLFENVAYLIGITHDLGKATDFFQKYLAEGDEKKNTHDAKSPM